MDLDSRPVRTISELPFSWILGRQSRIEIGLVSVVEKFFKVTQVG